MYILERGELYWIVKTAEKLFLNENIKVRGPIECDGEEILPLGYTDKHFKKFNKKLDEGKMLEAGVLKFWKCFECKPPEQCYYYQQAAERKKRDREFYEEVMKDEVLVGFSQGIPIFVPKEDFKPKGENKP